MKCYYQVLYSLPTCMPLASSIPSRQPVLFYRILLAGTRVEPGLGNEEYTQLWAKVVKKHPALAAVPLEPPEAAGPPVLEDEPDNDLLPIGPPPPVKPKRRKVERPSGSGGGGGRAGTGTTIVDDPDPPGPAHPLPP